MGDETHHSGSVARDGNATKRASVDPSTWKESQMQAASQNFETCYFAAGPRVCVCIKALGAMVAALSPCWTLRSVW